MFIFSTIITILLILIFLALYICCWLSFFKRYDSKTKKIFGYYFKVSIENNNIGFWRIQGKSKIIYNLWFWLLQITSLISFVIVNFFILMFVIKSFLEAVIKSFFKNKKNKILIEVGDRNRELLSCRDEIAPFCEVEIPKYLSEKNEVLNLVHSFEQKTLPVHKWNHFNHLIVATYYLRKYGLDNAYVQLKQNIISYNEAIGIPNTDKSGYHETITFFWLKWIYFNVLDQNRNNQPLLEVCNLMITFNRNLILGFYSSEVIKSSSARTQWVEPDLRKISMLE